MTQKSPKQPQYLLNSRSFHDIDELTEFMSIYRTIEFVQLSLNQFYADFTQADFEEFSFFFAQCNCPIHAIGERRKDYIHFSLLFNLSNKFPYYVHQRLIDIDTLSSFDMSRGADSIVSPNTLLVEVQIQKKVFEQYCILMKREDLLEPEFLKKDTIHLPMTLTPYRNYLKQFINLIQQQPHLLQSKDYQKLMIEDMLPLLIDAIPKTQELLVTPHPKRKTQLAYQAREYIFNHLESPLTLKTLYEVLGTSRRNLFYSFEATFGMTPMRYVKAMRLQGLRRELKLADSQDKMVMNIAHKWGFWSAGHLARDYKQMFGELPSETLKSCS